MAFQKRIKAGIVSWYRSCNYGSALQAFALAHTLGQCGAEARFIRYFRDGFTLKDRLLNTLSAAGVSDLLLGKVHPMDPRWRAFRRFRKHNLREVAVTGPAQLRRLCTGTDVFVAGSDQIWNRAHHGRDFEFLSFVPEGKRKISYASSIGTQDFPDKDKARIKTLLESFKYLSLREKSGALAVGGLLGRSDVQVCLDPTLLLDARQWKELSAGAMAPEGEYCLLYFVGSRPHDITDLVRLPACQLLSEENPSLIYPGATVLRKAGPLDFVKCISRASLVITDSFHACAFCCNLGVPFAALRRFAEDDPASQNSRLDDLFSLLGVSGSPDGRILLPGPPETLEKLREESLNYLKKSLRDE